jgi:HSP20 family protein
MEKALDRPRISQPTFFESGWMDKLFNAPIDEFFNFGKVINIPAVNVCETEKDFQLMIAAPGLEKSDFNIEAFDDMITIRAEKEKEVKEEKLGKFNRREYNFSSWSRSFTLPENCNYQKIDAEYKNGELKIVIPKMELKAPKKLKSIPVS